MDPRKEARDFARKFFETMADGKHDAITADWLRERHPELSSEEAEEYRVFCRSHTIVFRECYGDGQIMWPKWVALKNEIASL